MKFRDFFLCFFFILSFFSLPEWSMADDVKLISSVTVREEYNDNIFFDNNNEEEDFITTVSPGLRLTSRTERFTTRLSARFDGIIYSDNSKLNAIDQDFKADMSYQLTDKTGVTAKAGYKKDSRNDRDIEVMDGGSATGLVQDDSTRIRRTCDFSSSTMLNETTALSASYSFTRDDFENKDDNDILMNIINLGFTHNLSFIDELTVGRLNLGFARYDYIDSETIRPYYTGTSHYFTGTDIDSYSATIGASRNISEVFTILADIGGRYTKSKYRTRQLIKFGNTVWFDSGNIKDKNSSSGFIAQVTAAYTGELTDSSLNFYHDVRSSSGRSGATERTSMEFKLSRRLTYELRGSLSMQYYLNKADDGEFSSKGIDEKTWSIRPAVRYDFTKALFIEAAYYFISIKDDEDNTNKKRNQFFIKVSMDYPLFE